MLNVLTLDAEGVRSFNGFHLRNDKVAHIPR